MLVQRVETALNEKRTQELRRTRQEFETSAYPPHPSNPYPEKQAKKCIGKRLKPSSLVSHKEGGVEGPGTPPSYPVVDLGQGSLVGPTRLS